MYQIINFGVKNGPAGWNGLKTLKTWLITSSPWSKLNIGVSPLGNGNCPTSLGPPSTEFGLKSSS